jgi:spore coat polysaccharide biosynthesis predicted glycosyltransferase SpsG
LARIALRTTCGRTIGFGHLRRCLTLATELRAAGADCVFVLTGDGAGPPLVAEAGFRVGLDLSADLIVVDDYAVTGDELAALHRRGGLAVIDDLADRFLDADLVQNGGANAAELEYHTSTGCRRLLGPGYALLRPSFRGLPARTAAGVKRVLVTMGGSDPLGLTAHVTRLCLGQLPDVTVDAVIGPLAEEPEALANPRVKVHRAPADLTPLILAADLAVSAGGQTSYELAAAGLPAIAIRVADNQRENLRALSRVPTLIAVEPDVSKLGDTLEALAGDVELRQKMSDSGRALVDGLGAVRVSQGLMALLER